MQNRPLGSQIHWTSICIENYISTFFDKECHSCLTPMDCTSLRFIFSHQDEVLYAKDLMKYTKLSKATTSQTLNSLMKKGLIVMVSEKDDKRKKRIVLTPKGNQAINEVDELFVEITKNVEKDFTDEEKANLSKLLEKVRKNVSKGDMKK